MIRVLTVTTLVLSLLIHTRILNFYNYALYLSAVFQLPPKIPQVWRLLTGFCITGPQFGILMDTYFSMQLHSSACLDKRP